MAHRSAVVAAALAFGVTALTGACSSTKGGSAAALCQLVTSRSFTDVFQKGLDPTDTSRALAQVKAASVDLGQLRDAAPNEVRGAVADEIAYMDAVTKVLEKAKPDDPGAVVAAVNGLTAQREAAQTASVKLTSYQGAHCTGAGATTTKPA